MFKRRRQAGGRDDAYTTLCNAVGTVEADLTVSALDDSRVGAMRTAGSTATRDLAHLRNGLADAKMDAAVRDVSGDIGIYVQGPHSRAAARLVAPAADLSDAAFPFSTHRLLAVAGCDGVRAVRITFMGDAYAVGAPSSLASRAPAGTRTDGRGRRPRRARGRRSSDPEVALAREGLPPLAPGARLHRWSTRRRPRRGVQAQDGDAVPRARGDRRPGSRAARRGRRSACFTAGAAPRASAVPPRHGALYRDGSFAGYLRSAGFAFSVDASIGYAYVFGETAAAATRWCRSTNCAAASEVESYEHAAHASRKAAV